MDNRHRENLLQAENSRVGRIYHSQQIEKNTKISFMLLFQYQINQKGLGSPSNIKNEMWLRILLYTEKLQGNFFEKKTWMFSMLHRCVQANFF